MTQPIVWSLEMILDHEPGWTRAIYTTKELAKAGAPGVREWKPDGSDDGSEIEVTVGPFDSAWLVTPLLLDPAFEDLPHTASLLCETGEHPACAGCRCGCHPWDERHA